MTGGEDGFDGFYAAVYPRVVGLVTALAAGREDAEAIVQDAFVKLLGSWERVSRYDDPEAWVRQVAVRNLISRQRRSDVARRALPRLPRPGVQRGPTGDRVDVAAALRDLPLPMRAVLVLHHGLGLPVDQVADQLGVPVGTVKSRLSRARAAFAASYEGKETSADA